jgi:hypothetical protein
MPWISKPPPATWVIFGLRQNFSIIFTYYKNLYSKWDGYVNFFFHGARAPSGPGPPHYRGFTITLIHTTLGRTPLDEWSARRKDLYRATYNTQKRQISMPPARFEPTIPASKQPKTHSFDRVELRLLLNEIFKRAVLETVHNISRVQSSKKLRCTYHRICQSHIKLNCVYFCQTTQCYTPQDGIFLNVTIVYFSLAL